LKKGVAQGRSALSGTAYLRQATGVGVFLDQGFPAKCVKQSKKLPETSRPYRRDAFEIPPKRRPTVPVLSRKQSLRTLRADKSVPRAAAGGKVRAGLA
jgi:hypothetical protein